MPKLPDIGFCNSSHLDLDLGAPAHIIKTVLFTFPSSKECLSRENGGSPSVGFCAEIDFRNPTAKRRLQRKSECRNVYVLQGGLESCYIFEKQISCIRYFCSHMRGKGRSVKVGSRCCAKKERRKEEKRELKRTDHRRKERRGGGGPKFDTTQAETPIFLFVLLGLGDFL